MFVGSGAALTSRPGMTAVAVASLSPPVHRKSFDRLCKTLHASRPETHEAEAVGEGSGDRPGHHDGVGLGALAQPGGHLHGRAEQVVVVGNRLAGIEADAHLQLFAACEVEGLEGPLDGAGGVDGGGW
jgi:hypothetical protein